MATSELEGLVAQVYEAAAVPELWVDVLDRLGRLGGGVGASIVASAGPGNAWRWRATGVVERLIRDHTVSTIPNTRIHRGLAAAYPGFQSDPDIYTPEELASDPFLVDFLRPRGGGWCIGTIISAPSIEPIALSVERSYADGPPDRDLIATFDMLRPHLARAALWSAQLAFERVRAMTLTLGLIGLPAAVLDPKGRMMAANAPFEALMPTIFQDRRDRLRIDNASADELLNRAVAAMRVVTQPGTRSIAIAGSDEHRPAILHLLPIRGAAHDVFARAGLLAMVTPVQARESVSGVLLQGLFDLTPAEARVARSIVDGETIDSLAAGSGLSRETIRTQLRSAMSKVGVSRQIELVRLIGGTLVPASR